MTTTGLEKEWLVASHTAAAFSKSWRATRQLAEQLDEDQLAPISMAHEGRTFEVAFWSRFVEQFDEPKIELYLPVQAADFGERLALCLGHTTSTGIGRIVYFRDVPRFILDPGREWGKFQAALCGVPVSRMRQSYQAARVVQHLVDQEVRKTAIPLQRRIGALVEAQRDLEFERGLLEQEVRQLRLELGRHGAE